jgi:multidrug efflux pump subunit AcrB
MKEMKYLLNRPLAKNNLDLNIMPNDNNHKSSDYLYLEKLQFNPELRKSWLNFFITNFRVVILMIILITAWGLYAFFKLPRESNPEVKIPIAVVATSYPGASPADIEELVTKKLETGISGIKDIDTLTSRSANSFSSITVQFDAKANLEDSLRSLRDEVNSLKSTLPDEATEPIVQEISFDDQPILTLAITGPFDGFTLKKYANDIKDELEKISGVREVTVSGGDEREFEVAYDPQKLTIFNITPDQANQIIKASNLAVPAGTFEGRKFNYPVRSDARFFDVKKLENLPISHTEDSGIVYLKDIASVKDKAIERTKLSRLSIKSGSPQDAITISILKKTGGSVIAVSDQAKATLNRMLKNYPKDLKYDVVVDYSKSIRKDFDQLIHDFFLTVVLVFTILLLIVGLKEAFVAGLAVPLVFFVTFGVMDLAGITLNFLSMFSLLLSLGLLVDDAIVVVSATKQYLRTGKFTPEEAVLLVLNDFKVVLTTTTLTTVWAFLPLLSASGIIGSFIKSIPITVSVTLIASLLIALMINHPLAAVLERVRQTKRTYFVIIAILTAVILAASHFSTWEWFLAAALALGLIIWMLKWYRGNGKAKLEHNKSIMEQEWADDELIKQKLAGNGNGHANNLADKLIHGVLNFHLVIPTYDKYLRLVLSSAKNRWLTLGVAFGLFVLAILMPITGIVPTEFFPASDQNLIYLNIKASTGLKLAETNQIARRVEKKLMAYPEITNFSTIVGGANSGGRLSSGSGGSSHLASVTINLNDPEARNIKSYDLATKIRQDLESIKEATFTVSTPSAGPPSGSAFEARILGDDLQTLDKIAHDLEPILTAIPGVVNADISLKDSPAEYTFNLLPAKMELYNLNAAYVGSALRMAISGVEATKVIIDGKEIKVTARFAKDKIPTLESIQNLQILNTRKQPVFIKEVAKIELKPSVESITRIDQTRAVLLSAGVEGKTRPNAVLAEFQKQVQVKYKLPQNYEIVYGGENEQNTESVISIIRAMVVAVLLIISTLVIQFNSFRKAIIVLVTIPLALIGVFFGMALLRVNLAFPGLIGILALFGIVVKNAIILIDKINLNIESKIPFTEAIIDAGKSRLEAIFITSICTIIGIIPVTLSNETWMALGSAVIFGLMLSSFFTLFIIPVLFMTFVENREKAAVPPGIIQ